MVGRIGTCGLTISALLALTAPALADFSGQTILGPLALSSSVNGDNTGSNDNNDGWYSGTHVFDIWDGGDDVYALNWAGGDMTVTLTYDNIFADPDLFLYTPGNLDESTLDSIANTGVDAVTMLGAAPGTYYILVDTTAGSEGLYNVSVTPEPGTVMLLGLGGLMVARRRRARA